MSPRFAGLLRGGPLSTPLDDSDLHTLWSVVDYGIMSDPDKSLSRVSNAAAALSLPGLSPWREEAERQEPISTSIDVPTCPEAVAEGGRPRSTEAHLSSTVDTLSLHNLFSFFGDPQSNEDFIDCGNQSFHAVENSSFNRITQQQLASRQ
jgi:hypothetical protein